MNKERKINTENIENPMDQIANIEERMGNIEERMGNIEKLIEKKIKKLIVKVELVAPRASSIEDEELLNRIIFDFNLQVPGAVHATEDPNTPDRPPYSVKISVDEEHVEAFKNYMRQMTNADIYFRRSTFFTYFY